MLRKAVIINKYRKRDSLENLFTFAALLAMMSAFNCLDESDDVYWYLYKVGVIFYFTP